MDITSSTPPMHESSAHAAALSPKPAIVSSVDQAGPSNAKKPRIGGKQAVLSCAECRRMKWKCDRTFPCSNCTRKGIGYMCPDGTINTQGRKLSTVTVENLQKRIEELEAALATVYTRIASEPHPLLDYQNRQPAPATKPIDAPHIPQISPPVPTTVDAPAPLLLGSEVLLPPEHLHRSHHGQLTLGEQPGSSGFLGEAGPYYLHREHGDEEGQDSLPFAASGLITAEDICARLPPEHVARHLAQVYFDVGSFNNNFFTPDSFDLLVSHVYQSRQAGGLGGYSVASQQLAIVYLVLSLGVLMDTSLPAYHHSAAEYRSHASAALSMDPSCSIYLVQAINLLSRFNGAHRSAVWKAPSFWGLLGYGVRSALQLGLHLDGDKWGLPEEENKLRRRVFWETYAEDVIHSMTTGRPRMIQDTVIDVKLPSVDVHDHDQLYHHFKYLHIQLWAKLNDIQCRAGTTSYNEVIALDKQMRDLDGTVPPALRWTGQRSSVLRHDFQRLMIKLYLGEGLYFLHRASFSQALKERPDNPLESPMSLSYIAELDASRILIEVMRDALSLHDEIACRFLSFPFHAFSAIITFAAAAARAPTSSLTPTVLSHLDDGMTIYERIRYSPQRPWSTLRDLQHKAHLAVLSAIGVTDDDEQLDLLGTGTTLRRIAPKLQDEPDFAAVLADAVAQQPQTDFDIDSTFQNSGPESEFQEFLRSVGVSLDLNEDMAWAAGASTE